MANRLTKLAVVSYTAGRPYIPATPGYCVKQPYVIPAHQSTNVQIIYTTGPDGKVTQQVITTGGAYVPASTGYTTVCYPAQPEQTAIAPITNYSGITGWNGGARSIAQLDHDGYFEFQISGNPSIMSVGMTSTDTGNLPSDPEHGIYVQGSVAQVIESGNLRYTAPTAHAYANVYRITRVGQLVTYSGPGWTYTSAVPSTGSKFLDAAMYASGDFVDNPDIVDTTATATINGSFKALTGHAYQGAYAEIYGSLQSLTGVITGASPTNIVGSLQPLTGVMSEGDYTYVVGSFLPLDGIANGGFPEVTYQYLVGSLPPLAGYAYSLTGEVAAITGSLPSLAGLTGDYPYGEVRGSFAPLTGYADSGWPVPNEEYKLSPLLIDGFFMVDDVQFASVSSGLNVASVFDGVITVDGAIYDALSMSSLLGVSQAIEAIIGAGLNLGNGLSSVKGSDVNGGQVANYQPLQYAVNVQTSALTTYVNFDFQSYANVGQDLYGSKPDGVYRVRQGDDDGQGINAYIDFGTSTFGSTKVKSLGATYLGVATDGQLYLRVETETTDKLYRVIQRGPIMRAVPSKGIGARQWNVSLEVADATEFEMDTLEIQVGVSSGRWTSR